MTTTKDGITKTIVSDIAYAPTSLPSAVTYGNGLTTDMIYDVRNRLESLDIGGLKQLAYTMDNVGNITAIMDALDPTKTKTFTYDALYRLTEADGPWGSLNYSYDSVGNRTVEATDTGVTNYFYNANKLTLSSGEKAFNFSYDSNGNTTTEDTKQYIYNQNQRLIKVTDTVVLGEYTYNGNGQRVKKVIGAQTTIFHHSLGGQLIAESDSTGITTAEYVYLYGQPLAKVEGNNIYFYHNNHLGTPMIMTDESGSVVWEGEFLPFGEPLSITGTITNNLRFPGQYYDEETGLHYNYYRDYKPEVGGYLEKDISGIMRGTNHLYIYAKNNPLIYIDVMGLICQIVKIDTKTWMEDYEKVFYGDWIFDYYKQVNIKCYCWFYRDKRIDVTRIWYTQITKLLKCIEKDECGKEHIYYKTETELEKEIQKFSKYGGREYKKVWGTMYSTPGEGLESGGGCDCEPLSRPPGYSQG